MADFDSASYVQQGNLDNFQQNITLLQNFSSKLISYFRIFGQKIYPALEFSGKKYTQENATSPGTPT